MKVTVIIPAYNAEQFIEDAIKSVHSQTIAVHELIVVDDGSTDRTANISRAAGAEVLSLPENSGEGAARNAGLARATGEVIAWLDADDYWCTDHVEVVTKLLETHPQASVACADVERFGLRSGVLTGYAPVGEPANLFWTAVRDWLHPIIGAAMRTEALREIGGFDSNHGPSVDYDMWLRLSRSHSFVATRQVTSYWRFHPSQQSSNFGSQLAAVYVFRRRYLDNELIGKFPEDAQRFAGLMREVWCADIDTAIQERDIMLCATLLEAAVQIPDLEQSDFARYRTAVGLASETWNQRPFGDDDYAAEIEPLDEVPDVRSGRPVTFHVAVTNLGGLIWTDLPDNIRLTYRWWKDGEAVVADGVRSVLPSPIRPGERSLLQLQVMGPETSGEHVLAVDLVHEGVRWFGIDCRIDVDVLPAP